MSRESRIQYNPALSVKENATKNGVSEAAIRYYIKVNDVDRRYDRKQNVIEDCRKYLKKHPKATWDEVQKNTGHSLSTIRKYREYITTEKELIDFDSEKAKKRQLRQGNNYYATHPSVTQDLLREEQFHSEVLEPFCGGGTMAEVIKQNGYEVEAYDLIDRGYGKVGDFFKVDYPAKKYDIITNPPYDGNLIEIVKRCLSLCKKKVAILLPIQYLSGKERHSELYAKYPPSRVYIYCERINIAKDGNFEKYSDGGANMTIYAWYIWERGHKGETELKWIHNVKMEPEQPVAIPSEQVETKGDILEIRYKDRVNKRSSKYYGLVRCTKDYAYFYQGVPFSNWWTSPAIEYDGHTFSSSESLFMYFKAIKFGDAETAEKIAKSTYSKAKSLGKTVKRFNYLVWARVREESMYKALEQKLKFDAEFRAALLSDTFKGKTFVEASKRDTIWGIGAAATDDVLKKGVAAWKGANLLGKTLTRLRDNTLKQNNLKDRE